VAVMSELQRALDDGRAGRGPSLLEFVLYRMTPHSSSDDPTRYQGAGWMPRAQAHDPVRRLEALLDSVGLLPEAEKALIADAADRRVKQAIELGEATAPPPPESLTTDVVAGGSKTPGRTAHGGH
jgi:TPP-dependent pyruvate/acetoin dehydrogenase alpha subunit